MDQSAFENIGHSLHYQWFKNQDWKLRKNVPEIENLVHNIRWEKWKSTPWKGRGVTVITTKDEATSRLEDTLGW